MSAGKQAKKEKNKRVRKGKYGWYSDQGRLAKNRKRKLSKLLRRFERLGKLNDAANVKVKLGKAHLLV